MKEELFNIKTVKKGDAFRMAQGTVVEIVAVDRKENAYSYRYARDEQQREFTLPVKNLEVLLGTSVKTELPKKVKKVKK